MPVILQVSFRWDEDEDAVRAASLTRARKLAARTEFEWKLILRDPASRTSGAVYLFADRRKAETWRADLYKRRGRDIEARIFEIDEEASRLTRAPLDVETGKGRVARGRQRSGADSSRRSAAEPTTIPLEQLNASNDE